MSSHKQLPWDEAAAAIIPILQIRKLRLQMIKQFAKSHPARE